MAERHRAAALSAAVGLIAASCYDVEMPSAGRDGRLTDTELLEAVTKVAAWLVKHGPEGDWLLSQIGRYASLAMADGGGLPGEPDRL
ncbi:MAG TPA: hypothetical protein VGH89_02705 [Pseudonocardia sp.]|jgi:hypothetical protein